jgi:diadenosine tetraphosphate (Ap4A) HIT family hydrolase
MVTKNENKYAHLTAKERDKYSFPLRVLIEKGLIKCRVLDFGCGFGKDFEHLQSLGYEAEGFDPFYKPDEPDGKFDTILCFYVLNVLLPSERSQVLLRISQLITNGGKAYFAVRRDLKKEGYRIHHIHQVPTYQANVKLTFTSVYKNDFTEIYQYTTLSDLDASQADCVFCSNEMRKRLVCESFQAFAVEDKFPISKGHTLVIPKYHEANYFDLPFQHQKSCWQLVNYIKDILIKRYNPDGFNIGININDTAGQTVKHCHIHVIPRYKGDCEDPTGGVRALFPDKQNYLKS